MQVAYQKSQSGMIFLILVGSLLVIAATNNATPEGTASPTLSESKVAAMRAKAAAERAEAAASRAEEAAKRAEAATKLMPTQSADAARNGDSTLSSNSKDTPDIQEDEDLRCVRFMAGKKYADFNLVEREARVWLAKDGHAPPKELAAVFEVADEIEFVTVKFGQRVGERYWYVKFNRNLEVEKWGSRMHTAQD